MRVVEVVVEEGEKGGVEECMCGGWLEGLGEVERGIGGGGVE